MVSGAQILVSGVIADPQGNAQLFNLSNFFTNLASYTRLDNNTLLSSHPPTYILLHIKSVLMVPFLSFLRNIYPVFPIKSTVTAKKIRLNKKQIGISPDLLIPNRKFKGPHLSPQYSICNKK